MYRMQTLLVVTLMISVLMLISPTMTEAQTRHVVEFDFKEKTIDAPKNMDFHDYYIVIIKGINLNLYDVKVNNKDSTITYGVKFPTFEGIVLDGISDLIENLPPMGSMGSAISLVIDADSVSNIWVRPDTVSIGTTVRDPVTKALAEKREELIQIMTERKEELIHVNNELKEIARKIDNLALSTQTLSLSYLAVDDTLNEKLKKDFSYKKILKTSKAYREEIDQISKHLTESNKAYIEFSNKNSEIIRNQIDSTLIKFDKEIKELYAKTAGNVDKVFAGINAEKVGEWLSSLIHMENNKNDDYKSQPFQIIGDFSELTVKITPKKEEFGLPSFENTYHLPEPPRFYVGGGASFYYSPNMRNDAYSISSMEIDSVTTEYTLVDEEQPKGEIGISSAIQFGWTIGGNRRGNIHLTIGPAASIGKSIKPRLLTGFGIGYGRKQKVTVSLGVLMGHVDRLSNVYETGTVYNEKPDQIVVSKFRVKSAFSIGYIYNF